MYQIIEQTENKIEIALTEDLTKEEFIQVIHQLESLTSTFGPINIMFDAVELKNFDFKLVLTEYEFYKTYKDKINRIALVSGSDFQNFFTSLFGKFSDIDIRTFRPKEMEEARKWIFPSKLP